MRPRRGFTLIELLVVLVILGILAAIIVPAVQMAIRRAKKAQTEADINMMAGALASFKNKYGSYPPSRLIIHESGYLDTPPQGGQYYAGHTWARPQPSIGGHATGPDPSPGGEAAQEWQALVTRSYRALKSLFPRIAMSRGAYSNQRIGTTWHDVNGDGVMQAEPILLEGHECLFLFLAGVPDVGPSASGSGLELYGAAGLSADPVHPFRPSAARNPGTPGASSSRVGPFFEVKGAGRLVDDDHDGVPGFIDYQGSDQDARYLAYFSSSHQGYDPRDVRLEPQSSAVFDIGRPSYDPQVTALRQTRAFGPNPWSTSLPIPQSGATAWLRAQSFQILGAGQDRTYGPGGRLDLSGDAASYPDAPGTTGDRLDEEDNPGLR